MSTSTIDFAALKRAANIVSVIGRYIALKQDGHRYKGLCPFHTEDTPSFVVTPNMGDGGIYKCFGCDAHGDVITFVKEIEKVELGEAIRRVAELSGYDLPDTKPGSRAPRPAPSTDAPASETRKPLAPKPPPATAPAKPKEEWGPSKFVEAYDYEDRTGKFSYQVRRFHSHSIENPEKYAKDFFQRYRHPEDGAWVNGLTKNTYAKSPRNGEWYVFNEKKHDGWQTCELPEHTRELYRLPKVLAAESVVLVEGEKDVHTLEALQFVATSASGGSKAPWLDRFTNDLTGREVIHIPDHDKSGLPFADVIQKAIEKQVSSYLRIELPKGFKDITDYLSTIDNTPEEPNAKWLAVLDLIERAKRKRYEKEVERRGIVSPIEIMENAPGGMRAFLDPKTRPKGIPTGFYKYDEMTGGLLGGELTVLAARPAMGKTALALNVAQNIVSRPLPHGEQRKAVAIFSLEMSKESLMTRLICAEARVDQLQYRRGNIGPEEQHRIGDAMGTICEWPLFIGDHAAVTNEYIEEKVSLFESESEMQVGLIMVDYLQLMGAEGKKHGDDRARISSISRGLKLMSRSLNKPIWALSQLSRACEQRPGDKRPMLSDLRESGTIEQDADVVAFVFREEVYRPDKEKVRGIGELILAKQRNGPTGRIKLAWRANVTRFENLSPEQEYE